MRFNSIINLISTIESENPIGDTISVESKRKVFAEKKSVRQSEFYQAAATGLKPEITFVTWKDEYKGESELEYDSKTYRIIRTFIKDEKEIELICEGAVNRGAS